MGGEGSGPSGLETDHLRTNTRLDWIEEDREREKRRNNIIIKGLDEKGRCTKDWIENWPKTEINVEVKIKKVWEITIGKEKKIVGTQCEEEGMKKRAMENKSKLGKKKIYIENVLTWLERRTRKGQRKGGRILEKKERMRF